MTIRAAVLGDPVSHSLSPLLHGYWLKRYNIDGQYDAIHVASDALPEALKQLKNDGFAGCNLTIPHKESALELVDEISDVARQIGAVNTVMMRKDGSLYGTNTDAQGFIGNLQYHIEDLAPYLEHCFILGAGGAARAVYYGLKQAGAKRISISNRNRERAEAYDADVIDWERKDDALEGVTLLVNTTSLGMNGQHPLELSIEGLPKTSLVTDIVYQPLTTPLLQTAKDRGNPTVGGIGMLIHQAAPGFEAWFGQAPEMDDEVYTLLEGKLP